MRKFRTLQNAGKTKVNEIIKTPSETTPDQTLSVREIMSRYANGTLNDLQQELEYNEDDEDYRGLDPVEMYNLSRQAGEIVQSEIETSKKRKTKADREKLKEELRKEIANENPPA